MLSPENVNGRDRDTAAYRDREKKAGRLLENELMESDIERFLQHGSTNGERVQIYLKYFQIDDDQRLLAGLLDDL